MDIKSWYKERGLQFVWQRGNSLLNRYSIGSGKAIRRINNLMRELSELGCLPTFFIPGNIVARYPQFAKHLQQMGAELAVHSYHHINLNHLPIPLAEKQVVRAIRAFDSSGIENRGLRCPYLGYSNEMLNSLPKGLVDYSSNQAIFWDVADKKIGNCRGILFNELEKFYKAKDSSKNVCLPFTLSNLVEIPVCVPDDIQLIDGLLLNAEDISQAWIRFLEKTYLRGELFTLIFHTELASMYGVPFVELVRRARQYQPGVWITRLRDISDWWREKSKFGIEIASAANELKLIFDCSSRGTILVKNLDLHGRGAVWDGKYYRLQSETLEVPVCPRPFIGLPDSAPEPVVSFLREEGYILDSSKTARDCGLILEKDLLSSLVNNVELINFIESSTAPLIRYWRWPYGAKSALSITGDLDALSLMDYASRFIQT